MFWQGSLEVMSKYYFSRLMLKVVSAISSPNINNHIHRSTSCPPHKHAVKKSVSVGSLGPEIADTMQSILSYPVTLKRVTLKRVTLLVLVLI